ncbi:MAG: hypothetical protein PGN23_12815 [Sphingomonas adhaesiva]|uniref:hypothetical protein n=1 Tax=Sphingomonas adhaesiva TaxID=28212 RepID=UPI002FF7BE56
MNLRSHAFLALLAHAANEGIRTGRFDPAAPNRNPIEPRTSVLFDAPLGSVPMRVSMSDWRFDEARIAVSAWPMPDVDRWVEAVNAKALAGDVTAIGNLERKNGRLMLFNPFDPLVFMRQNRRAALLALPMPSETADPLRLYPRYLSFAAAA